VFEWAKAHGLRSDNPADWDVLRHVLAPVRKVQPTQHVASLPYEKLPEYFARLRGDADIMLRTKERSEFGSLCLQFVILCAVRLNEAVNATWSEFDLDGRVWNIPGSRMKMKQDHKVPLSSAAMDVLKEALEYKYSDYVFPGERGRISGHTVLNVAKRVYDSKFTASGGKTKLSGEKDTSPRCGAVPITVHGFRSTFSTWVAEQTNFSREEREHALAHKIPSAVEASYQRGKLFDKRVQLMQAWADFVTGAATGDKVVQLRKR
jgi:integrase